MAQMPDIKPVVNKEPERDKKKAGFLARLFGGGAAGGSAGFGGGAGGLAGGGLLATKAGLMALILVGTSVAGGIGLVGYRLFGPGADATGSSDNLQLFAPKPKEQANAGGQAASGDGTSQSLSMLSQGNASPKAPDAAAGGATTDATAGGAAASASASGSAVGGSNGSINRAGNSGNGVSKLLKNVSKFGALTGPSGGGGSGAVASSAPQKAAVAPSAASKGVLSGFKNGGAAKTSGGTSRSLAGKHFGGAVGQGFGVLGNQKGAQSSYAAGQTYDGTASGGSNIGANGTPIGGPGTSAAGGGPAQPKSIAGPVNQNTSTNVPTPPATPMAPWQNAIKTAEAIVAISGMLLLAASMISKAKPYGAMISKIIGFVVAGLGVMVIAIGAQIAHGQYGQTLQGGVLAAAGAGLVLAGMMAGLADNTNGKGVTGDPPITDANAGGTTAFDSTSGPSSGMFSGINPYVLIGGGAALIGTAAAAMIPPKTYPASDFKNGPPPDLHLWGYQEFPSQTALKKMVA